MCEHNENFPLSFFALLIAYLDIIPCFFCSFNRGLLNNFFVWQKKVT